MKRSSILLILAVLILVGVPAVTRADGWEKYSTNSSGDVFYYDTDSIAKTPPSLVKVRIKGVPAREGAITAGFEQVLEFDCQKRISRKTESKVTRADGKVESQFESPNWAPVIAGTSTAVLFDTICKKLGRRFER